MDNLYHPHKFGSTENPLPAALRLAKRGIPIVAFDARSKRPITPHGLRDATTDEGTIRAWFARPGLVPAVATGEASGIDVFDLDIPKHREAAEWLAENEGRLPETFSYASRSGGRHVWFRHHPGLRCSNARPKPGIDVKGASGTAIAWFAIGLPILSRGTLAAWPSWLLDALAPPARATYEPPAPAAWCGNDRRARAYAEGALKGAIRRVASAPPGTRNAALNASAFALSRFAVDGSLTAGEIAYALASAATAAGLDGRETAATLKSALAAGGVA